MNRMAPKIVQILLILLPPGLPVMSAKSNSVRPARFGATVGSPCRLVLAKSVPSN